MPLLQRMLRVEIAKKEKHRSTKYLESRKRTSSSAAICWMDCMAQSLVQHRRTSRRQIMHSALSLILFDCSSPFSYHSFVMLRALGNHCQRKHLKRIPTTRFFFVTVFSVFKMQIRDWMIPVDPSLTSGSESRIAKQRSIRGPSSSEKTLERKAVTSSSLEVLHFTWSSVIEILQ